MSTFRIDPPRSGGRRVLTTAEMRAADAYTISTLEVPGRALMEVAGRALAREVAVRAPHGAAIGVVCGRGNNGGDGLVAARLLVDWGYEVEVVLCGPLERCTAETRENAAAAAHVVAALRVVTDADDFAHLPVPGHYALLIDALLGTGLTGTVTGLAAEAIAWMNGHGVPIVSADIPSGICGGHRAGPRERGPCRRDGRVRGEQARSLALSRGRSCGRTRRGRRRHSRARDGRPRSGSPLARRCRVAACVRAPCSRRA